jgi:hypothetical protein
MSYSHLTIEKRNVIYRMRSQNYSDAEIARCIGCHRGTIGRECKRNANVEGRYDPGNAQTKANRRRRAHLRRPKTGHPRLMDYVANRLADLWSPEQIAGRLAHCPPPEMENLSISHTTIYRWIWSDPERTRQFRPLLRVARKPRRKPYGKPSRQGQILGKRSIDERPQEANERTRAAAGGQSLLCYYARRIHMVSATNGRAGNHRDPSPEPCSWPKAVNLRGLGTASPSYCERIRRTYGPEIATSACCASHVNAPYDLRIKA